MGVWIAFQRERTRALQAVESRGKVAAAGLCVVCFGGASMCQTEHSE